MSLILEIGMTAMLSLHNSPFKKDAYQFPYLLVEKSVYENFYIQLKNSSRTAIVSANMWNPRTTLWNTEIGYRNNGWTIAVGHQSEHELDKKDTNTESFDYVKVSYRIEFGEFKKSNSKQYNIEEID